jgi:hypothetical protein
MPVETSIITYEVFDKPRKMHVIVSEGIKKFSFANVSRWEDLTIGGPTYPQNSNVEIVAKAHVKIGEETATYFMDSLALGVDFHITGRPAYTTGFNHSQLADGFVYPPIVKAGEVKKVSIVDESIDQPSPELASLPVTELDYLEAEDSTRWKSTYVPFENGPKTFIADKSIWVHDFDTKRPDRPLKSTQEVNVSGTFIKDDMLYGRPVGATKNSLWYGIPMSILIPDEELHKEMYNDEEPLPIRAALPNGRLSSKERYMVIPLAYLTSQTTRLKTYLSKNKNNIKEK